jgi:hypothetical protein
MNGYHFSSAFADDDLAPQRPKSTDSRGKVDRGSVKGLIDPAPDNRVVAVVVDAFLMIRKEVEHDFFWNWHLVYNPGTVLY